MELEIIILSEVSQREKDKYHYITYMWNIKYDTNVCFIDKFRLRDIENRLVVANGAGGGGGMEWKLGMSRCKLLSMKQTFVSYLMFHI